MGKGGQGEEAAPGVHVRGTISCNKGWSESCCGTQPLALETLRAQATSMVLRILGMIDTRKRFGASRVPCGPCAIWNGAAGFAKRP